MPIFFILRSLADFRRLWSTRLFPCPLASRLVDDRIYLFPRISLVLVIYPPTDMPNPFQTSHCSKSYDIYVHIPRESRFHYPIELTISLSPPLAHTFFRVFSVRAPRATSIFLDTIQASLAQHRMDIQVCAA